MIKRMSIVFVSVVGLPSVVYAHGGRPHDWMELWQTWGLEPFTLGCLTVSGLVYAFGLRRLWRASSRGKGIARWEAACFALGWLALFVALVSPLHPWGQVLFSAHMAQHEVMMLVAAPLMVLGKPVIAFLWFMPGDGARTASSWTRARWWRTTWSGISRPISAWVIHAAALWVWHLPVLFQATLRSEVAHTLQHVSFLGSALLFWWALLHCRRGMEGYGVAVLGLFTTALHNGLLGALLTFASKAWYPAYAATTGWWGLSPLEDQQLGGLIMWIPSGLAYVVAGLALFAGWLRESERAAARQDKIRSSQAAGSTLLMLGIVLAGCGADAAGPLAYVTNERDGTISVIDTKTHRVVSTIVGVAVSPDGGRLYVALGRANSVGVIDARTHEIIDSIPVGERTWGIALTPDGQKLLAANGISNDVHVIDTRTHEVIARVPAGDGPWGIAMAE